MRVTTKEFIRGGKAVAPTLIGVIPFAVVFGFAMKNALFSGLQSSFFSLSLLAGASQLAAVQLYATESPAFIIVLTAVIINLRYSMYSLSIQPILGDKPYMLRLFASFIITDQSYAFTMTEYEKDPGNHFLPSFFLGASMLIVISWEAGILLGYNLGAVIPATHFLDFVIPLIFMSLLIPHLGGRDRQVASLTGGLSAVIMVPLLPLQLGLLAAILIGIGSGICYSMIQEQREGMKA